MHGLVSNPQTVDDTLGFLFSLAFHEFSVSSIFTALRGTPQGEVDLKIGEFESRLRIIRRPGAIGALWTMVPQLTAGDDNMRYGVLKLFEVLSHLSHRNQAILSSLGLVKTLLDRFCDTRADSTVSDKERQLSQKLLKRLLDMGATTDEARLLYQRTVKDDETLDTEMLEVVRAGIKSRWLEHFSMESPAALLLTGESIKGVPPLGFTFMVWVWYSCLHRR